MKKLIHLIILLFSIDSLSAQIIAGSEIYYERTSNRTYKITAVVYRACNSSPLTNIDGWVINNTYKQNLPFTRTSITKINDTCGQPCQNINDFSNPGYEKHIYETTLDLNISAYQVFLNQCKISVAIFQNGRDGNLKTQNIGKYYNEATINICDSTISNHSPIFSMEPKFHMNANNPLSYSPGPQDTADYDSLAFSIEPVLVDYGTPIQYKTGYSYQVPLTPYCPPNPGVTNCRALPNAKPPRGCYFDETLCTIITTPTGVGEKGYIRIKIREFRKINNQWVELGSVSRDYRAQTIASSYNNPPYFVYSNTVSNSMCSEQLSLKFTAKDDAFLPMQTISDSTYVIYDYGFTPSTFNTSKGLREMQSDLTFYDDGSGKIKTKYYTIAAYDKKCNISLITKTSKITTKPVVEHTHQYTLDSCNILSTEVKLKDTTLQYSTYSYVTGFYTTNLSSNKYQLNGDGKYILYTNANVGNNYCTLTNIDTINVVNSFPKAILSSAKDTTVCSSAPIEIGFKPSSIPNLKSWDWYKNDTLVNSIDSSFKDTYYNTSNYKLIMFDQKGCRSFSNVLFKSVKTNYNLFPYDNLNKCPDDSLNITAYENIFKAPVTYQWTFDNETFPNNTSSIDLRHNKPDTQHYLRLKVTDDNHCIYKDSIWMTVYQSPRFKTITSKPKICYYEEYTLKLSEVKNDKIKMVYWKPDNSIIQYSNKDSITLISANPRTFYVTLIDSNDCFHIDTFELKPIANPKVELNKIKDVCSGVQVTANVKITDPDRASIYWYFNKQLIKTQDTFLQFIPDTSGQIQFKVGNDDYCFASDSEQFKVFNYPKVKILGDTIYNYRNRINLTCQSDYNNYYWSTGYTGQTLNIWAYSLGQPGEYTFMVSSANTLGCRSSDTITIRTDGFTGLQQLNYLGVKVYPNPAQDAITIENLEPGTIDILGIEGQLIQTIEIKQAIETIDISMLAKGIYIIKTDKGICSFVKE